MVQFLGILKMDIVLKKDISPYKYKVTFFNLKKGSRRTIRFGAAGYSDFTIHKDEERRQRYILRHKKNEDWTKSGILTKGFWSYHLLWNKPTIAASINDIQSKFNVKIKR